MPAPSFPADGVINAAAPAAALSPGELFSIYGSNLAAGVQAPALLPLPATMAAATVQIDGITAPLVYVSPLQINAQVPWEVTPGSATISVTHAGVTSSQAVSIAAAGPAIFTLYGSQQAAALNQDYTVNSHANPAPAKQAILLFGTGFGAVSPSVSTGAAAGSDPPSQVIANVTATVNGGAANVLFVGLAPGFAGLWQINVALPAGVSGAVPVILSVGGTASNTVTIWIE
ncbi:MAG TPA: IPT/TIG domain-containing protein [Bryobacteraceae bacterium]|nr:IPT/TIG domain-containing protein [Bryobacteraceae bacterium]